MTKNRLEFLSDGVFAIVMTLLVVEITIPEIVNLKEVVPEILSYFLSFAVLSNLWTIHNFLFSIMSRNTTRALSTLNLLLLAFITLIPFSTSLLGSFPGQSVAISVYSIHILIIMLMIFAIREFITFSPAIQNPSLEEFTRNQNDRLYGTARILLNVIIAIIAVILSTISTTAAIIILLIPVILGIIPGSLGYVMRITRIDKLAQDL